MELYLDIAIRAALAAGEKIMTIYKMPFNVTEKADQSPLTAADIASDNTIRRFLASTHLQIISEESEIPVFEHREKAEYIWLVDPLDGTREFVSRNGEFTVNIALIRNGQPVLGVIYCPALDVLYYGMKAIGSFRINSAGKNYCNEIHHIKLPVVFSERYGIAASRSHFDEKTKQYTEALFKKYPEATIVNKGSSLKFCLLAEGSANIYPRFGTTMEWDTAAGHAILKHTGGIVREYNTTKELTYNKQDLRNPYFIAYSANTAISD